MNNILLKYAVIGSFLRGLGQFALRHPILTIGAGVGGYYGATKWYPAYRRRKMATEMYKQMIKQQVKAYQNLMNYYLSVPKVYEFNQYY